jgi:putative ABC transport system permease protein
MFARFRMFVARLAGALRPNRLDDDLRAQIEAHVDEATDDYVRQGLPRAEARRRACVDFGGIAGVEEASRDTQGAWLRDLTKDVRYGARTLLRNPAFTTVAIVSLAVGIGANTAIFSLFNSLVLRPRPIANPDRIVELYTGERGGSVEGTSYPSYLDFRDRSGIFTGLAAYGLRQFRLGDATGVEQIWGELVSANYFDVLGVPLVNGRGFAADENEVPGRNPVAIVSHGLWQRRFNGDPDLVGRAIVLNGRRLTVVGIAPHQYTGGIRGLASEVWVPIMMGPQLEARYSEALLTRHSRWLASIGRLKPEVSLEQARARFEVLSRELQAAHPEEWASVRPETGRLRELFVTVFSERETRLPPGMMEGAYGAAALLFVIVNLVLAIACMNLAGMLLARALSRRKEIAIRLAIGASRRRIVRQLVTESLLLSIVAGAAGFVFATWLVGALLAFAPALPEGFRLAVDLRLDWRVFVYAAGFSTLTGILFGLAPALHSSRTEVSAVLKNDAMAFTSVHRRARTRTALVVAQLALSLLLLIAAGLLLRSLDNVRPTSLGFASDNVLVAWINLNDGVGYEVPRTQAFYRELLDRTAALPAVQAVTLTDSMPGGFMNRQRRGTDIEGYRPAPGEHLELDAASVGPRYFTNLRVPIVAGRDFDERDREGAPCVAIVNEVFARRYFAGHSPLGKHLAKYESFRKPERSECAIVGVARDDGFQSLQKDARPFFWTASQQSARPRMLLLAHTDGDPAAQVAAVRQIVRSIDPLVPATDIQPLRDFFGAMVYPFQLVAIVLAACGALALALAALGIYGIVSYSVAQRTREVGIRIALGALRSDILKTVVGEGMAVVAVGLAIGLLLSAALTRVLQNVLFDVGLLFGVEATDTLTFAGVTLLLAAVAAVACVIPARRAAKVDPMVALRYE